MEQVSTLQLAAALALAADQPQARLALLGTVQPHVDAATEHLVRAWVHGEAGTTTAVERSQVLSGLLLEQSQRAPALAGELKRWITDELGVGVPTAQSGNGVANSLDVAQADGVVVQARDIRGGLHIHPTPAGAADPVLVPRQVPPPPAHFTNRTRELQRLEDVARERGAAPAVVVISGPAGVGKTALARTLIKTMTDLFPDGLLHADLQGRSRGGPARPSELLGEFLRALGQQQVPMELPELMALWRTVTADARIAIVLDDALSAAQVRPLLPTSPGALTLVTSRGRLTGLGLDGAVFHPLHVLDTDHSLELLRHRVGDDRVRREPDAARHMAEACGGLPLAVCVAAARVAARPRQPLATMAAALGGDGQRALDALRVDGESAVRVALDESYRLLSPEVARGYRRLSLAPVTVLSAPLAAAMCALPQAAAERLLDELAEVNLVEDLGVATGTNLAHYRYHDLVRAHAERLTVHQDPPEEREAALTRAVDYYLATATAAENLLTPSHRTLRRDYSQPVEEPPFHEERGALRWLDAERSRLMAVLRSAAERGAYAAAWQMADAMWPLFLRLRPYDLWLEAHEIGLAAARNAPDRHGVSRMLTSGGTGLRNVGRYDEAIQWFDEALRMAQEDAAADAHDPRVRRDEAQAVHGLGQTYRLAGRLPEAAEHFRRALTLRETIGYRRGAALSRLCLGDVALAADRPEEAIGHLTRARDELVSEGDRYDGARALALLGRAHAHTGGHAEGRRQLLVALGEFEETGAVHWQAHVLEILGEVAEARGDTRRARSWYEQSRARYAPVSESDTRRLENRLRPLAAD